MKLIAVFIIIIFSTLNSLGQIVDERTGITIEFVANENTFPKSWQNKEIDAKAISLDLSQMERSLHIIKIAISKYPKEVLTKNIKKIYILKSIEFFGQPYGGTNSTDIVYIANSGIMAGYSDNYIEKSFHHEFSSILLRNYPKKIKNQKWKELNNLKYGDGGVEALKLSKDSQLYDSIFNANGFLYEYANSSFENDFNSFAESIFLPKDDFYEIINANSRLLKKYNLIIEFYSSINKEFSEEYFRSFISDDNN